MAAGYPGTPLAKKLGIRNGFILRIIDPPAYYFDLFTDLPAAITITKNKKSKKNFIHYFTNRAAKLQRDISSLRDEILPDGMIWISWPKKSSGVQSGITEDIIRKIALQNELVDIKVCAVDDTWSGLKLVIPVKERSINLVD